MTSDQETDQALSIQPQSLHVRDLHGTGTLLTIPSCSRCCHSRSHSGQSRSRPAPIASTPGPVLVPLKPQSMDEASRREKRSFKRSTLHDDMCNNGHGHHQLWTKYVVHIILLKKHDKYSDSGKYGPNSSNNRPTSEPGVTPAPAGGEHLLLPVPRDSRSSQSRSRHSREIKGGRSSRRGSSRGILPLPCKTLLHVHGPVRNVKQSLNTDWPMQTPPYVTHTQVGSCSRGKWKFWAHIFWPPYSIQYISS